MGDIRDIKNKRWKFLDKLYEESEGDELKWCNEYAIGKSLAFDKKTTDKISQYLIKEGSIERKAAGGTIGITHLGICQVEEKIEQRRMVIRKVIEDLPKKVETKNTVSQVKVKMSGKTVFISHAKEDSFLAGVIKTEIDKVFGKGLKVFVSSIPGIIPPGSEWFDEIIGKLTENNAFIILVTPYSEERPFVWFEIGFSWLRKINKNCKMYVLCAPPINPGKLPQPLDRLQAVSLAKENETRAFFNELIERFNLGNLDTLEFAKIREALTDYSVIATEKKYITTSYNGPYSEYSGEELKQVILDVLSQEWRRHDPISGGLSTIFSGELIDFNYFDRREKLPPGTSKKYLKEVGSRFKLEVEWEGENAIRFKKQPWDIL